MAVTNLFQDNIPFRLPSLGLCGLPVCKVLRALSMASKEAASRERVSALGNCTTFRDDAHDTYESVG